MSVKIETPRNKWVARKIVVTLTEEQNTKLERLLDDRRKSNPREGIASLMQEALNNLYNIAYDSE